MTKHRRDTDGSSQQAEDVSLPVRILPSRRTRLAESAILILGAALGIVGWMVALSLGRPVTMTELLQSSLPFIAILAVIGFLLIRQQQRYFGSRGRYWLVIERDRLIIVKPDKQEAYEWRNLTRFVVEKDERSTMDEEKHTNQHLSVYLAANDTGADGRSLIIVADDFAAKLPGNPLERAQRICAILNDIRRWATDTTAEAGALSMRTVSGIAVASHLTASAATVERQ